MYTKWNEMKCLVCKRFSHFNKLTIKNYVVNSYYKKIYNNKHELSQNEWMNECESNFI